MNHPKQFVSWSYEMEREMISLVLGNAEVTVSSKWAQTEVRGSPLSMNHPKKFVFWSYEMERGDDLTSAWKRSRESVIQMCTN